MMAVKKMNANDVIQIIFSETDRTKVNFGESMNRTIASFQKKKSYHVNELLRYEKSEFIINSYLAVLNRYPDEKGLSFYLDKLNQKKTSKESLLFRLKYSSEGRFAGVKIKRLTIAFLLSVMKRMFKITR